jgi:hypothetical protein
MFAAIISNLVAGRGRNSDSDGGVKPVMIGNSQTAVSIPIRAPLNVRLLRQ